MLTWMVQYKQAKMFAHYEIIGKYTVTELLFFVVHEYYQRKEITICSFENETDMYRIVLNESV